MTIEELKAEKRQLEENILELVRQFQLQTRASVTSVKLVCFESMLMGGEWELILNKVECEVRI